MRPPHAHALTHSTNNTLEKAEPTRTLRRTLQTLRRHGNVGDGGLDLGRLGLEVGAADVADLAFSLPGRHDEVVGWSQVDHA